MRYARRRNQDQMMCDTRRKRRGVKQRARGMRRQRGKLKIRITSVLSERSTRGENDSLSPSLFLYIYIYLYLSTKLVALAAWNITAEKHYARSFDLHCKCD